MIKELLRNNTTFATPVVLYLVHSLGFDVVGYESETIAEYLKSVEPKSNRHVINRTIAALGLLTSNAFWYDPATFNIICNSLNRQAFPMSKPAELLDMAWGVSEATLLLGDATDENEHGVTAFSEYIVRYIRYLLKTEGVFTPPDSLDFVGKIPSTFALDAEEHAVLMQNQSDLRAALINRQVNRQMLEMLQQLASLQLPMRKEASKELGELITEYAKEVS